MSATPHHTTPVKLTQRLRNLVFVVPLFFLAACGGGGGGSSTPNAPTTNLVATSVLSTAPVASCPNGGITVEGGIDSNGNKILDPSEVTSTQYVCNGAVGQTGAGGTNGLTTLALVLSEPAGANCATGGKKISAGQDANNNAVLDASEASSTAYICNGIVGGNGLNSLVSIVPEPAGAFCTYGGNKVNNGVDTNANGTLDSTEITASNYVCNGAPGPAGSGGITWINVTGTSVQAISNTGYLANNDTAQVTITLPTAPAIGDIIKVTGAGAGGWKIAQNAGQSIVLPPTLAPSWTPRDPTGIGMGGMAWWSSIASSIDGAKVTAAAQSGSLYTSSDAGITWTLRDPTGSGMGTSWNGLASSADGTKLVATGIAGLYTSTDSGLNWVARDPTGTGMGSMWNSVASSADGTKLIVTDGMGGLYTSTDTGVTWTARNPAGMLGTSFGRLASSADGTKLVVAAAGMSSLLYISTDSGVTWSPRDPTGTGYGMGYSSIAVSADGTKLIAAPSGGSLFYISTDAGVTWILRTVPATGTYSPQSVIIALTADGKKLFAVSNNLIFTSSDFGVSWRSEPFVNLTSSTTISPVSVVAAAGGTRIFIGTMYGSLYTWNSRSTTGITGSISGDQYYSVELQCTSTNTFTALGAEGVLTLQ